LKLLLLLAGNIVYEVEVIAMAERSLIFERKENVLLFTAGHVI